MGGVRQSAAIVLLSLAAFVTACSSGNAAVDENGSSTSTSAPAGPDDGTPAGAASVPFDEPITVKILPWGDGFLAVAVVDESGELAYDARLSDDGRTWRAIDFEPPDDTDPPLPNTRFVVSEGGHLAVAYGALTVATTHDLERWTEVDLPWPSELPDLDGSPVSLAIGPAGWVVLIATRPKDGTTGPTDDFVYRGGFDGEAPQWDVVPFRGNEVVASAAGFLAASDAGVWFSVDGADWAVRQVPAEFGRPDAVSAVERGVVVRTGTDEGARILRGASDGSALAPVDMAVLPERAELDAFGLDSSAARGLAAVVEDYMVGSETSSDLPLVESSGSELPPRRYRLVVTRDGFEWLVEDIAVADTEPPGTVATAAVNGDTVAVWTRQGFEVRDLP